MLTTLYNSILSYVADPQASQTDGVIGGATAVTLRTVLQDPLLTAAQVTPPSASGY